MLSLGCAAAQAQSRACLPFMEQLRNSAYQTFGPRAPVATLAGQTQQESACNPNARSRVGALGLNQFMPATATDAGRRWPAQCKPVNPLDPGWAFRCRDQYMLSLLMYRKKVYNECDRWTIALRDYNGGAGWINREMKLCRAVDCCDPYSPEDLELFNAGRSIANFIENTEYPHRIHRLAKGYQGWGRTVCP